MYLGPSVRENQPYETLCQFKDDEYPLLDTYRSSARKTLICRSQDWKTTIESFLSIICAKYLHERGYIAIKVVIGPHFFSFSKKKYFIFKDFFSPKMSGDSLLETGDSCPCDGLLSSIDAISWWQQKVTTISECVFNIIWPFCGKHPFFLTVDNRWNCFLFKVIWHWTLLLVFYGSDNSLTFPEGK